MKKLSTINNVVDKVKKVELMKTKQQIQDEIAELQKQLEEMEKPKEYWYLRTDSKGLFTVSLIEDLIWVREGKGLCPHPDQPHGLGRFETREEAEETSAVLIGALDLAKDTTMRYTQEEVKDIQAWNNLLQRGKHVIKAIEEGTYE